MDSEDAIVTSGAGGGERVSWSSLRSILDAGEEAILKLDSAVRVAAEHGNAVVEPESTRLGPPVPDPRKIICLGRNYTDHAEEAGMDSPVLPELFTKFATSLTGPSDPIVLPAFSDQVDYEAELAVVIGSRCRNVTSEEATNVLAGAMAFNDVSARDIQLQTSQWTAGKAVDGFAPCGPCLVTLDELGDLQSLHVKSRVNGVLRQDTNTSQMIFSVADIVSFISMVMTLEPGDIIATGTPAGVGLFQNPPAFLHDGDSVEVEIERLGILRNDVIAQSDSVHLDPCIQRWRAVQLS